MERFFNIAGPCNPADHYMLPAMARLPEVVSLIRKKQYFVVHAQRQCGKTTAFLQRVINGGGEIIREKAYDQVCRYMDHLGQSEGRLVVFDPDLGGDWDAKLGHEDIGREGKMVHLFRC